MQSVILLHAVLLSVVVPFPCKTRGNNDINQANLLHYLMPNYKENFFAAFKEKEKKDIQPRFLFCNLMLSLESLL